MKGQFSPFFNLEKNPFGETPDPDFFYASTQHHRALKALVGGIREGKGFSLLTGEVGTGKTLLARLILGMIKNEANTALILYPKFTEVELLQAILEEFEVPGVGADLNTAKSYVDHLNRFLLESAAQGRRSVLLIDEAQLLSSEALETIRLLTNLETQTQKLLQIVLIAQPEIHQTLDQVNLRQLKQRLGVQVKLQGLNGDETERYVRCRIELAGTGNFIRFEGPAIKIIFQLSAGAPRRINQLCEKLLRAAEEKRMRLVTLDLAKEVFQFRFTFFAKEPSV